MLTFPAEYHLTAEISDRRPRTAVAAEGLLLGPSVPVEFRVEQPVILGLALPRGVEQAVITTQTLQDSHAEPPHPDEQQARCGFPRLAGTTDARASFTRA